MDADLLNFIRNHNLDVDDFYNAHGQSAQSFYSIMKSLDKLFAYNTTPCSKSGHTIRDRQGHCIVCNPATIAFSLRKKQIGHIYIACSTKRQITKVGMSTEKIKTRLSKLNSRRVGNTDDWEIVSSIRCAYANTVELNVHNELKKYQIKGDIYGTTESKELFRCSYHKAREVLDLIINDCSIKLLESKSYIHIKDKFKFRNLISR